MNEAPQQPIPSQPKAPIYNPVWEKIFGTQSLLDSVKTICADFKFNQDLEKAAMMQREQIRNEPRYDSVIKELGELIDSYKL